MPPSVKMGPIMAHCRSEDWNLTDVRLRINGKRSVVGCWNRGGGIGLRVGAGTDNGSGFGTLSLLSKGAARKCMRSWIHYSQV